MLSTLTVELTLIASTLAVIVTTTSFLDSIENKPVELIFPAVADQDMRSLIAI